MAFQRDMSLDLSKPMPGNYDLERKAKRATEKAHEQREMQAALIRDRRTCRVPRCEWMAKKLRVEPAHQRHRGMGGNPSGDRTTRATVIALCIRHHRMYDLEGLEIEPLTAKVFDGPCDYYRRNPETGRREHIGTEKLIGVSEARR